MILPPPGASFREFGQALIEHWRKRRRITALGRVCARMPVFHPGRAGAGSGPWIVTGEAEAVDALKAPLTGGSVIGYRVTLEATFVKTGPIYQRVLQETRLSSFSLLADDTPVHVVQPRGILLTARFVRRRLDLEQLAAPGLAALLQRFGIPDHYLVDATRLRCTEQALRPGDALHVYNAQVRTAVVPGVSPAGYRAPPSRLELVAFGEAPLLITDILPAGLKQALRDVDVDEV